MPKHLQAPAREQLPGLRLDWELVRLASVLAQRVCSQQVPEQERLEPVSVQVLLLAVQRQEWEPGLCHPSLPS
jgi:hypothetical protein